MYAVYTSITRHHMKPAADQCAAGTLRRAARSIARVYDRQLASVGLTTTQFSILRTLRRHGTPVPLSALAEELVFERTSLYRALEPMRRDGLVDVSPGLGRAKQVALTPGGVRRIAKATPRWAHAQETFVARFGRAEWSRLAGQLVDIVGIARAMPLDEQ
jgi:DNA-binding MarR family transcriptional regulator